MGEPFSPGVRLVARHKHGNVVLAIRGIRGMSREQVQAVEQELLCSLAKSMGIEHDLAASVITFVVEPV